MLCKVKCLCAADRKCFRRLDVFRRVEYRIDRWQRGAESCNFKESTVFCFVYLFLRNQKQKHNRARPNSWYCVNLLWWTKCFVMKKARVRSDFSSNIPIFTSSFIMSGCHFGNTDSDCDQPASLCRFDWWFLLRTVKLPRSGNSSGQRNQQKNFRICIEGTLVEMIMQRVEIIVFFTLFVWFGSSKSPNPRKDVLQFTYRTKSKTACSLLDRLWIWIRQRSFCTFKCVLIVHDTQIIRFMFWVYFYNLDDDRYVSYVIKRIKNRKSKIVNRKFNKDLIYRYFTDSVWSEVLWLCVLRRSTIKQTKNN